MTVSTVTNLAVFALHVRPIRHKLGRVFVTWRSKGLSGHSENKLLSNVTNSAMLGYGPIRHRLGRVCVTGPIRHKLGRVWVRSVPWVTNLAVFSLHVVENGSMGILVNFFWFPNVTNWALFVTVCDRFDPYIGAKMSQSLPCLKCSKLSRGS